MKKRSVRILTAVLVVVMIMSVTTAALAAGQEEPQGSQQSKGEALERLFVRYAPGSLAEFLSVRQEHQEFHEARKLVHEELKTNARLKFSEIIDAYLAGELSAEDAMNALLSQKDDSAQFREELKELMEAKKEENEAIKTQSESIRLQIGQALKADEPDAGQIKALLEQTLALLKQHLSVDYKYAAMEDALIAQYYG